MTPKTPSSKPDPAHRAGGPIGPAKPGARGRSNLLALSSLAVIAVYSAGYVRTQAAARRFQNDEGRKTRMAPQTVEIPAPPAPPVAPAVDPVLVAKLTTPVAPELPKATATVDTPAVSPPPAPPPEPAPPVAVAVPTTTDATPSTPPAATQPAAIPAPIATTPPTSPSPAANVAEIPAATPSAPTAAKTVDTGAHSATETSILPADIKPSKWKDGKYSGWGSCRHGDIEATVEIRAGRIVSAVVSKCRTVYSCNVIDKVVPQVVVRQSPDIDSVSGSTQSADSFYWAVYSALQDAEIKPAAAK